jgi:hypothetical protein
MIEFLNSPLGDHQRLIVVYEPLSGVARCTTDPSELAQHFSAASHRELRILCAKRFPERLSTESMSHAVVVLDVSAGAAETLFRVARDVVGPLVQSMAPVAVKDRRTTAAVDSAHRLASTLYVAIGEAHGQTLLPLPSVELSKQGAHIISEAKSARNLDHNDREAVTALEALASTWLRIIKV